MVTSLQGIIVFIKIIFLSNEKHKMAKFKRLVYLHNLCESDNMWPNCISEMKQLKNVKL